VFVFPGDESHFFQTVGFIVIGNPLALPIPMPDILKPPPPKKAEREERGLSTDCTPVPPSKVCPDCYSYEVVTFADEKCAEGQGNEGKRHGRVKNQGKVRTR
jgi:hypothetical protein